MMKRRFARHICETERETESCVTLYYTFSFSLCHLSWSISFSALAFIWTTSQALKKFIFLAEYYANTTLNRIFFHTP